MVIKNSSSRSAQACSSRALMPPECTPCGLESQHLLNVVVLRARHEITGAILALDPYSAHRLKRIHVIPAKAGIQFIQSDMNPRLREGDIFSFSLHKRDEAERNRHNKADDSRYPGPEGSGRLCLSDRRVQRRGPHRDGPFFRGGADNPAEKMGDRKRRLNRPHGRDRAAVRQGAWLYLFVSDIKAPPEKFCGAG